MILALTTTKKSIKLGWEKKSSIQHWKSSTLYFVFHYDHLVFFYFFQINLSYFILFFQFSIKNNYTQLKFIIIFYFCYVVELNVSKL